MEYRMNECPVSYITPESRRLVEVMFENSYVKEQTGASFFGLDSATWDARLFDTIRTCAGEDAKVEEAQDKARKIDLR